jgi:hypothetical protein
MAATSGIATLGRLGDALEQPATIAAAINETAKRVVREHRMKKMCLTARSGGLDAHHRPSLYASIPAIS